MSEAPSAQPYSLFERYLLLNCWVGAFMLLFTAGQPYFGGTPPLDPPLLLPFTLVNVALLTALIWWLLSRRGRTFSHRNINFAVPVSLYVLAALVILWGSRG